MRAWKSTNGCEAWKPPKRLSKAVLPGLGAELAAAHAEEKDCRPRVVESAGDGACSKGWRGGGDRSYGVGSAKDMNIGLLAMVLYGLRPFGWPNP